MTRIKIIYWLLIAAFSIICLGIFNLEIIQGRKFRDLSDKNCIRLLPQDGSRGRILDRNGSLIVGSSLAYDVMIMPRQLSGIDETLFGLAKILKTDFKGLRENFRNNYSAPFIPVTVFRDVNVKTVMALEELKFDLDGVMVQSHPIRYYPYGNLACHVVGYLGEIDRWRLTKLADYGYNTKDIVGFGGIEERYDYYLRQEQGALSMNVDHRGKFVRLLGFKAPVDGKDIQLTLDLKIQKLVENELEGHKGCVIIMNPLTGEILAMASRPDFNPTQILKNSSAYLGQLFNNTNAPMVNRAISGLYPPASTFKPVVASSAMETGKINLSTRFFCSGSMRIGNRDFNCWEKHGEEDLIAAIAHSCDIFFYHTGLLAGPQLIYDYALKYGFAKPTGIELPYEASGLVPNPLWKKIYRFQGWYDGDTANLSIGQGDVLVTPLQLARMMAGFANRGILVTPYIVKTVAGKDFSPYKKRVVRIPVKEATITYIRKGLRSVVSDPAGTGKILFALPVEISGKTGTAQAGGGKQSHAWFVGFFPSSAPKYVICVFLERGGSGFMATTLAKKIIEGMLSEGIL